MSDAGKQAYVPGFEYDVFVSYGWVNNFPEEEDKLETGWVSQFKKKLHRRIDEKLGRIGAARMFFDTVRLGKNQDFTPQIEAAVRGSAVFVAMFSDGYIESPACREEITLFNQGVGGKLARSGRLFLVRIDHVDPESWPDEFHGFLENVIGYEFFMRDPVHQRPQRLQSKHDVYHSRLEELRSDLSDKLKQLRADAAASVTRTHQAKGPAAQPTEPRATVLVAQSTADLRKQRKSLVSYCSSAGLRVLGAEPYPVDADRFRGAFLADLGQAHVFVQLLSDCYSDRTEEFPQGKERWQLHKARNAGLPILQWRDDEIDVDDIDDPQQRDLVRHPDVRTGLPASFHKDVSDRARRAFDVGKAPVDPGKKRLVLLKYSEADEQFTKEVVETFRQANVVCRPTQNGRSMVDRLREIAFDALVVVLGQCPHDWLEERGDELMAVELNLKDQAPLRVFCFCDDAQVPPFVGQDVLEIHGRDELDQLLTAIQNIGDGQ